MRRVEGVGEGQQGLLRSVPFPGPAESSCGTSLLPPLPPQAVLKTPGFPGWCQNANPAGLAGSALTCSASSPALSTGDGLP